MKVEQIDARFPDQPYTRRLMQSPVETIGNVHEVLTILARRAIGLPASSLEARQVQWLLGDVKGRPSMYWQRDPAKRMSDIAAQEQEALGVFALLAAVAEDWDLVVQFTGGRPLGARVQAKRDHDGNLQGLARHIATATRARLPAASLLPAMTRLRERFRDGTVKPDARVAVIATGLFVRLAGEPDPPAACRRWLAGESLELTAGDARPRIADGDDPRVAIFERYAPELTDDSRIDGELARVMSPEYQARFLASVEETERVHGPDTARPMREHMMRAVIAARDEALIPAHLARRPLPDGWSARVDPLVAWWLGGEIEPAQAQAAREALAARYRAFSLQIIPKLTRAVDALVLGDTEQVRRLFPVPSRKPFVPGAFFKDDPEKLLAYLGAAITAGARRADVEPAWLDFLARRSPASSREMRHGELKWRHLLGLAAAIGSLGGGDPRGCGRDLQRTLTGA